MRVFAVHAAPLSLFWYWVNERYQIYLRREAGLPWPWTRDEILQRYRFTNVFRELDRTTVWMRRCLTKPNDHGDSGLMIFNCALFRMFGTVEMSQALGGWQTRWRPEWVMRVARDRLDQGLKVFTGAYMITNCGKAGRGVPKEQIVVREFLTPIWEGREWLARVARESRSLRVFCDAVREYRGWGGGGFMAAELAEDLKHTRVLGHAYDRCVWTNTGPGALRGLARLHHTRPVSEIRALALDYILGILNDQDKWRGSHVPQLDAHDVEMSLCEFDKYCRVKFGEGRPRSRYVRQRQEM